MKLFQSLPEHSAGNGVPGNPWHDLLNVQRLLCVAACVLFLSNCARTAPATAQSYEMLSVEDVSQPTAEREPLAGKLGTIVVTGGWKDGKPELEKPRGSAAGVTGKLGGSAALGGTMALAGGPIGAAIYGIGFAMLGIQKGIEEGKAGKAIHQELNPIFEQIDLVPMVRKELRKWLDENEALPSPRPVMLAAGQADTRVELIFEKAKLDSVLHAWQFNVGNRPRLVLMIKTTVRTKRAGQYEPLFEETIEYNGRRELNGLEEQFHAEVQRAAAYIAGRVLLQLAKIEDLPGVWEEFAEVPK